MAAQKRNIKLIVFGILAYLLFLLALFPISLLQKWIPKESLPVSVENLSGTLWEGAAIVKQREVGRLDIAWDLSLSSILTGQLASDIEVKGQKFNFEGFVGYGLGGSIDVRNAQGYLTAELVNQFTRRQQATLNGDFELSGLNLVYDLNAKQAKSAEGRLVWQGGMVSYPVARKKTQSEMPMLVAQFGANEGNLQAEVTTTDGQSVGQLNLKSDGWAGIAIKRRIVDLAGQKWPGKGNADTTVFEVSEKVF